MAKDVENIFILPKPQHKKRDETNTDVDIVQESITEEARPVIEPILNNNLPGEHSYNHQDRDIDIEIVEDIKEHSVLANNSLIQEEIIYKIVNALNNEEIIDNLAKKIATELLGTLNSAQRAYFIKENSNLEVDIEKMKKRDMILNYCSVLPIVLEKKLKEISSNIIINKTLRS